MPERDRYAPGTPSWTDLTTTDLEAATAFYTALFGWEAEDQHDADGNRIYTMFRLRGLDVAGAAPMPDDHREAGMPTMWNISIAVDDAAAAAAAAAAAGGAVLAEPFAVMEAGVGAVLTDPEGAMFSAWQAGSHIGARLVGEPGAPSWAELNTRDPDAAAAFYGAVFGWSVTPNPDAAEGTDYRLIGLGNEVVGGIFNMTGVVPDAVPAHWMVYFGVAGCDESATKAITLGGSIVAGPMVVAAGRFAIVQDPQGGTLTLFEPAARGA